MGEYATYRGRSIKIGTCENMYYLRDDQRAQLDAVEGSSVARYFDAETLAAIRFRFPFPDEDNLEPGSFEDYDRGLRIPGGWQIPTEWGDHGIVQFTSTAGYNLCLLCPESIDNSPGSGPIDVDGVKVHRNGFRGYPEIVQQGYRDGDLRTIVTCGACGGRWNLPLEQAREVAAAFRLEADRQEYRPDLNGWGDANSESTKRNLHEIADRILAGYVREAVQS